jgi:sortase (surface protein transpeptidase)
VACVIIVFGAVALVYALKRTPQAPLATPAQQSTPLAKKTKTDATFGLPQRLIIPSIKVDANITYMGLTKSGDMDVPPDLINVGWYKYGTKPGEVGSAVIAGHLEGTKDLGVFIGLNKLQPGDIVKIRNDRDETIEFIVREKRTYKQDERPSEIFNAADGSHLNLITCTGVWSNAQQRYSHRLVVFTDKK